MTILIQAPKQIGRTVFETDCLLFSRLFHRPYNPKNVDQRLLIMFSTGLLNRSINLEQYLIAALGQDWTFTYPVKVGQTLSCDYSISLLKEEKNVYQIHIQLYADKILVATGIWTVMFNQLIYERI